jgi:hypothetical protein
VARAAEQAVILEAALAAAVGDGKDVIGLPSRARLPPAASIGTGAAGRTRALPIGLRAFDVESAPLAETVVALPHLLADVSRTAAQPPLVHALVAAERAAARRDDHGTAPAADWRAVLVPIGLAPAAAVHGAAADGAHAGSFGAWAAPR